MTNPSSHPEPSAGTPVSYIPYLQRSDGSVHAARRRMRDGRVALLGYSSQDLLIEALGDVSWLLLDIPGLQRLYNQSRYEVYLQDIFIPPDKRHYGWLRDGQT